MIKIRPASPPDIPALADMGAALGPAVGAGLDGPRDAVYFTRCLATGRTIFIAYDGDAVAGYVQLNPEPIYRPFRAQGIPEIQDLNVLPDHRGRGIGAALVAACETAARAQGKTEIGISVGLDRSFGAAQRLYAKAGYIPDGAGVAWDDAPARIGDIKPIDGNLTLKMVKTLE